MKQTIQRRFWRGQKVVLSTGELGKILSQHGSYYTVISVFDSKVQNVYLSDMLLYEGGSLNVYQEAQICC
jgi:hypothetical protein